MEELDRLHWAGYSDDRQVVKRLVAGYVATAVANRNEVGYNLLWIAQFRLNTTDPPILEELLPVGLTEEMPGDERADKTVEKLLTMLRYHNGILASVEIVCETDDIIVIVVKLTGEKVLMLGRIVDGKYVRTLAAVAATPGAWRHVP